ncbi:SAM-dependent methyltransferase [Deltaproteobacteria bacterium]|nr:SAM-dependent methyltransferase [Deltaproteobacteria bacterium]
MRSFQTPSTLSPPYAVLLAATSMVVISYEILLMRLLAIGLWHHFASMIISMALLGFGAAGSILFLFFNRIRNNLNGWLIFLSGVASLSFPLAFSLSQRTGLDPLLIIWQPSQWLYMMATYLIMSIPLLFAGGIIGLILTGAAERVERMYAVDLLGAGFGALIIVPVLYAAAPWEILPILGYLILLGAIWCCLNLKRPLIGFAVLAISGLLLTISYIGIPPIPKIHETKGLPMTLNFPDSRIETTRDGPLGKIHVVGSSLIRYVPGLSLNFGLNNDENHADIPEQKAIFVDADGLSPISSFSGNTDKLEYLDFTSMALPYHVRKARKMLIVGTGGGTDILLGILQGVPQIVALEANQQIADLLSGPFADFSGDLYSRPDVRLEVGEARQFIRSTDEIFDFIQISMTDSFGNSTGGLHSATESYLYTSEAFENYLYHLSDSGILAITRWLKLPPRDSLRIISTALMALRGMDISDRPEEHLIFIRSWKTSTILISKTAFSRDEISRVKEFCGARSFDIAYYSGITKQVANQYDVQDFPYYFEGAKALCGPEADSFLKNYIFDVSPTTDDRPFFSQFFKWNKMPGMLRYIEWEWLITTDMGYIFILVTFAQAVIAGLVLVLFPLVFLKWTGRYDERPGQGVQRSDIWGTIIYFGCIGIGFMFMEMALLPRFTLMLSHPVYAASVVLAAVLVFAGCGSLFSRRIESTTARSLWIAVVAISCWVILHNITGDWLFDRTMGWPLGYRLVFSSLLISVPAFFMGWPFPNGLRFMSRKYPDLVPWAWGINGCASVIGAVLAKCLTIEIGFRLLMLGACLMYFIAALTFQIRFKAHDYPGSSEIR